MQSPIWVLERHEDTREMILETLSHAGMRAVGFDSVEELVAHATETKTPRACATFVDAMTALDHERVIHQALGSRVVVFTTWPTQTVPWVRVGISSFLVKPFELGALYELAQRPVPALVKCDRSHPHLAAVTPLQAAR